MAEEISKSEIFKPVVRQVLSVFSGPADPHYKAFYDEIVTRCIADVAGILQSDGNGANAGTRKTSRFVGPSHDTGERFNSRPGAELAAMYRTLAQQHGDESAKNLILNNLPGFTKGIVYTPHPTEMLNEVAIEAQEKVMAELIKLPGLFEIKPGQDAYLGAKRAELLSALQSLSEAVVRPISQSLTIDQEMRRSISFSQRQFDSIPGIVDTILEATHTFLSSGPSGLDEKQLRKFSYLIEPETWSPGDQDSKPDMTAEKLAEGIKLSHRAMMFHYYRTLIALGANIVPTDKADEDARAAIGAIERLMYSLFKTGCEFCVPPELPTFENAMKRLRGVEEVITDSYHHYGAFSRRFSVYATSNFFEDFKQNFDTIAHQEAESYKNADKFVDDLFKLRSMKKVSVIKDPERKSITVIDSLIIQAMNFRDTALRVQVRQNAKAHAEVLDTIIEMLPPGQIPDKVCERLHDENDSASIEKLLAEFESDQSFRTLVQQTMRTNLTEMRERLAGGWKPNPGSESDRKDYQMYQVMESLGLAARHPDRIPRYLIAECRSKTDILEAFFLLKVMESLEAPDIKEKVEIVNLVEHPDRVMETGKDATTAAAQMTAGALENEQFHEHQLSITSSNHLLESYSLKDTENGHRMSVAEAKRTYGITLAEGDEAREVTGVKMMMGAGSDMTKAGGVAAAAALMDATEKTRAALLNDKDHPVLLVDYIGCGGGIHRTQPVSTSFETVQGQSMRQSPENIAQKVLTLLTDFLRRRLAMNPELKTLDQGGRYLAKYLGGDDRRLMSRVNMGNLAALPQNDALWNTCTKARTYAMMQKYEKLYDSDEFRELMSYSGDMYANLTRFAARPPGRQETQTGFLAPVNVKHLRAIGFGAALNSAGICAPLFFGGSEYLKSKHTTDEQALRQMYLFDPKAQDTINRMTYGVIMADMDVAWKYLGREPPPTRPELKDIAARSPGYADSAHPTPEERRAMAETCLAKIHLEYNEVARKLLRLHQSVNAGQISHISAAADSKWITGELLKTLPSALREQLELSLEHIRKPRRELAELFDKMAKGEPDPEKVNRRSPEYNGIIYPAMGTLFECFEHVPRAYTRPKWVMATEPQQSQQAAL